MRSADGREEEIEKMQMGKCPDDSATTAKGDILHNISAVWSNN